MVLDPTERLRAIIKTQTEIAASDLDVLTTTQLIVDRSLALTEAKGAVIEVPEGAEMVYKFVAGDASPYLGTRLRRESSLSGLCVREREVLRSDDTGSDERVDAEACARVGAGSMVCVPLFHRDETVGVLKVYAPEAHHFDAGDVEALELLAELIAARISHATLFEIEAHDSRHDLLTGLPNRRAYEERLGGEAARVRRFGDRVSLCLLDLDGFKAVNDNFGHPAGDEVLRAAARIISGARASDETFRIGGDEFAVLLHGSDRKEAEGGAQRIAAEIAEAGLGEGQITVSYGIVPVGVDPEASHAAADAALVAAKDRLYQRS
jgi:diguanylate cyclase (GGDEF)-like protein